MSRITASQRDRIIAEVQAISDREGVSFWTIAQLARAEDRVRKILKAA